MMFEGTTSLHRRAKARREAAARGLTMVPPFDHEWIMRARARLAWRCSSSARTSARCSSRSAAAACVSGVVGGDQAVEARRHGVGVEPSGAASMKNSIDAGEVRTLEGAHSIADGLMAVRPGDLNFAHVRKFVDRIDTVEDRPDCRRASAGSFVSAKIVAEPSGAATVAAALASRPPTTPPVVAIISGGNLDPADSKNLARGDARVQVVIAESMRIEMFEMERMQSTWENLVDYDMSESGVRPLTLRELDGDGVRPRIVPRRAARLQPVERDDRAARADRGALPGASVDQSRSPTAPPKRTTSIALSQVAAGRRRRDAGPELHADVGRGAKPRRRGADVPSAHRSVVGTGLGRVRARGHAARRGCSTCRTRTTRPARCCRTPSMRRIVDRCQQTGTWLLSDEVYLGAEIDRAAHEELLGHERSRDRDQRPVEGLRHSRRPHRMDRRPGTLVADCWSQHDYITIGPNKMRDRIARVAVEAKNRERCYARTGEILRHNLPIAREWAASFGGRLDVDRASRRRDRPDEVRAPTRQA